MRQSVACAGSSAPCEYAICSSYLNRPGREVLGILGSGAWHFGQGRQARIALSCLHLIFSQMAARAESLWTMRLRLYRVGTGLQRYSAPAPPHRVGVSKVGEKCGQECHQSYPQKRRPGPTSSDVDGTATGEEPKPSPSVREGLRNFSKRSHARSAFKIRRFGDRRAVTGL
jgi:hypothetical protein